ncbi:MAG: hypothetical protein LBK50_02870 [Candidatus Nomurabacteria bacterium]|jgi:hypothetical protein|nr:hypothetical protein [Candidatus Nomurabacteria bacterium]
MFTATEVIEKTMNYLVADASEAVGWGIGFYTELYYDGWNECDEIIIYSRACLVSDEYIALTGKTKRAHGDKHCLQLFQIESSRAREYFTKPWEKTIRNGHNYVYPEAKVTIVSANQCNKLVFPIWMLTFSKGQSRKYGGTEYSTSFHSRDETNVWIAGEEGYNAQLPTDLAEYIINNIGAIYFGMSEYLP